MQSITSMSTEDPGWKRGEEEGEGEGEGEGEMKDCMKCALSKHKHT